MEKSIKGTRTEQNLLKAFAGESQARSRYVFFASKAKKDGYEQIAAIFQETALNEKLRDDRGTNAAALNEAAAEAEARMRANREAYEQGLAEERAIRERRGKEDGAERQDRKVKGRVTVSFSITDPVRTSRYLEVPAYLCEGGGDVVVEITVNRAGEVVNARVQSGGDECMRESALRAARVSRFNIDQSAPARQQGTITYIFIPQ